MNILVLQIRIPSYRIRLFELLALMDGVTVTIGYSHFDRQSDKELLESLCELVHIDFRSVNGVFWQKRVYSLLRSKRFDVVVAEFNVRLLSNLFIYILYKFQRYRLYLWGHGFGLRGGHWIQRTRLALAKMSDGVLFYTEQRAREFVDRGLPYDKAHSIGNTVHVSKPGRCNACRRDAYLYFGRLHGRKKIQEALKAFAKADIPSTVRFLVVGSGDQESSLVTLVYDLGIETKVDFFPATYDEIELRYHFDRSLAYVSPGAVGLGVNHSFAHGVPVITMPCESHGPEFNFLVNGENSVICKDFNELSKILSHLTTNKAYVDDLGRSALEYYVNHLGMDTVAKKFAKAIGY